MDSVNFSDTDRAKKLLAQSAPINHRVTNPKKDMLAVKNGRTKLFSRVWRRKGAILKVTRMNNGRIRTYPLALFLLYLDKIRRLPVFHRNLVLSFVCLSNVMEPSEEELESRKVVIPCCNPLPVRIDFVFLLRKAITCSLSSTSELSWLLTLHPATENS